MWYYQINGAIRFFCVATAVQFLLFRKKDRIMKKALSLLLALVLCLSLCACGGGSNIGGANTNTTASQEEDIVLYNEEEGYVFINLKRFSELYTVVELTTENWQDYLEVYSWEHTTTETDAFGEIVSQETKTKYAIGAKGGKYFYTQGLAIELKDKETGELMSCPVFNGEQLDVTKDFSLDQYECTRIKGTLYLIDIPEETIYESTKSGNRWVNIGYSDISWGPTFACYISGRLIDVGIII
jgi:hypothetical protein